MHYAVLLLVVLLAFPDAPGAFRRGCLAVLADEQRHCRLYLVRLGARSFLLQWLRIVRSGDRLEFELK